MQALGAGVGFGGKLVPGLLVCIGNSQDQTTTQVVGPEGGTITFGKNSLVIPPGALDQPVTITATAPAGLFLVAQFAPQGLQFNRDVYLSLDYKHCNWADSTNFQVDYLTDDLTTLLETEPTTVQVVKHDVVATIRHFSVYAVARRSVYAAAE
jgi:hypothetical protein